MACSSVNALFPGDIGKPVAVDDMTFNPSLIYPGDEVTMNVNLRNRGSSVSIENVEARLDLTGAFEPITDTVFSEGILPSSIQTFVFRFKINEMTLPGTYQIPLELTYSKGTLRETEHYNLLIEVQGYHSIDIKNINLSSVSPHIGDTVTLSAIIENKGSLEARDVSVQLTSTTGEFGAIVPLTETTVYLDNIMPHSVQNVSFDLLLSEQVEPGVYNFLLAANALDLETAETENVSIEVKGRPNLILTGIDFSIETRTKDKKILQGDSFSLSVQLDNIGTEDAKAVEIILEVDEGITGLKESYVGNIEADDSGAAIFDLSVTPTAHTGDHAAVISINYIDELGRRQSLKKNVSFYVHPAPPADPIGYLVMLAIILVIVYFIVRQFLRHKRLRKK
jgi:hypothetical protein